MLEKGPDDYTPLDLNGSCRGPRSSKLTPDSSSSSSTLLRGFQSVCWLKPYHVWHKFNRVCMSVFYPPQVHTCVNLCVCDFKQDGGFG